MVGDPAAEDAHRRAHEGCEHGQLAGLHLAHAELVEEVAGQEGGQADEAAEGDGIDQAEGPAVFLEQAGDVVTEAGVGVHVVGLLGVHHHHHHRDQDADAGKAIHGLPAEGLCQWRCQQRRHGRTHVAGAYQAHGQALVAWREGAAAQAQRHAEAGTGNTQQHAHGQQVVERLDHEIAVGHGQCNAAHFHQSGVLAADVLGQHPQREAHQCPGKDGDGQHQPLLGGRELEGLADEGRHHTIDDPDGA